MFRPERTNGLGMEIAVAIQSPCVDEVFSPASQGSAQPVSQWDAKPPFGALHQSSRYLAMKDLSQPPLALAVAELVLERHSPGQFDNMVVEHWNPCLETAGHRGTIHFSQHFVWKVGLGIHRHHPVLHTVRFRPAGSI